MRGLLLLLVVIGSGLKGTSTQEPAVVDLLAQATCSNTTSVDVVNQQCMDAYNVAIVIPSTMGLADSTPEAAVGLISNFMLDNSNVICSETTNYSKAVSCLFYVNKKCNNIADSDTSAYPPENTFLRDIDKLCGVVMDITNETNHAVEIETQASCRVGTEASVFALELQKCMDLNNIAVQLSDAVSLANTVDDSTLYQAFKNILRINNANICSNLASYLKATNCMQYLMYKCKVGATFFKWMPSQAYIQFNFNSMCSLIQQLTTMEPDVVSISQNLDCSVQSDIFTGQQKCFDIYNITVQIENPESIAAITDSSMLNIDLLLFQHTVELCQDTDAYKNALLCLYHIMYACDTSNAISIDTFLSMDMARRLTVDRRCAVLQEAVYECLRNKEEEIGQCSSDGGTTDGDQVQDTTSCRYKDKTTACEYPVVRTCGEESVKVYEAGKTIDTACRNRPDTNIILPNGHTHRVDCSSVKGRQDGYLDCLLYNGIYLEFPSLENSGEAIDHILKSFSIDMLTEMCSNISTYQDAVNCTLTVEERCRSEQKPVPDYSTVTSGLAALCGRKEGFDVDCVKNADQSRCKKSTTPSTPEDTCSSVFAYQKCMSDVIESCDDDTERLYKNLLTSQLPLGCESQVTPSTSTATTGTQLPSSGVETRATRPEPNMAFKNVASVTTLLFCIIGSL